MNKIATSNQLGSNGRLGNMMFQIAATIGYADKHGGQAIFPSLICDHPLAKKDYSPYFQNQLTLGNMPSGITAIQYQEPNFHYDEIPEYEYVDLHGYFQSEKYFEHCKEKIQHAFEPSHKLVEKLIKKYRDIIRLGTCGIHVRRGDYVNNGFHHQLGMDYYNRSIDYMKEKADTFVVFSDDISWCRQYFPTSCIFIEGNEDIEDLFLMSFMQHQIIANSSFSWWASYLCGLNTVLFHTVIAPKCWVAKTIFLETKDLYTCNMIKL